MIIYVQLLCLTDGAKRMLCMFVIITEKLRLPVTVGRVFTRPFFDCWIVDDVSKPKQRLGFPGEEG